MIAGSTHSLPVHLIAHFRIHMSKLGQAIGIPHDHGEEVARV